MRKILRLLALAIVLVAGVIWAATGAHVGWTKTSRPNGTIDEVTGIVDQTPVKCFVAGVDFLGAAFGGAALLGGASLFFRKSNKQQQTNNQ
jgi:hypothetical protein